MSEGRAAAMRRRRAKIFAALGDETRLALVAKLCRGSDLSISELTETAAEARISRQAVTKHLRVLENAGLVRCSRTGRERRFSYRPEAAEEMREYLEFVTAKWDEALERLKMFVEN